MEVIVKLTFFCVNFTAELDQSHRVQMKRVVFNISITPRSFETKLIDVSDHIITHMHIYQNIALNAREGIKILIIIDQHINLFKYNFN